MGSSPTAPIRKIGDIIPYVKQEIRDRVDADIERICATVLDSELSDVPGMLNYVISRIASVEIRHNLCYATINEAMGILACVQRELYGRLAVPYEIQKCKENGDVFK